MPKDRRVNSSSFDRSMVSPYTCSSKISDCNNCDSYSPHVGNEREWEEARCPICMEHPHNAVLLLCSSREKGCRPFICDTSYRHSNCLDQFSKTSAAASLQISTKEPQPELVCPLCRGLVTGWDIIQPARRFMNSKTRSCSLETCSFSGNYAELRMHARLKHPSERPSQASPTRQSNWTILEQQREMEDALALESDMDYDWDGWFNQGEWHGDDMWSDESFFDFPSGMSDIEDELVDELFSGLSLSSFSLYLSSPEEEIMDSGSSRSNDGLQMGAASANSDSRSNNEGGNALPSSRPRSSFHNENGPTISRSRSGYHRESDVTNWMSRSSNHRENDSTISSSRPRYHSENATTSLTRTSHQRENGSTISRSRSSSHRENAPANSRPRSSYPRENAPESSRTRSSYPRNAPESSRMRSSYPRNAPESSRTRSSYPTVNAPASSRTRSSYHTAYAQPSSRARSRYYRGEVAPPARQAAPRQLPGSSRQPQSHSGHREE